MMIPPIDPGPWAMIGAASFICGSARLTVTMAIIILEITGDFRYVPGIAIAVVFSKLTGGMFSDSIYHSIIHLKNLPFLEDIPASRMDGVSVGNIMNTPVVVVRSLESTTNLRRVLSGCKHSAFPVVREEGSSLIEPYLLGSRYLTFIPGSDGVIPSPNSADHAGFARRHSEVRPSTKLTLCGIGTLFKTRFSKW